mmetsp:Transcript_52211/g.151717  ORF Transcript_52211/g.151717 Transcript_52211/m.151717 type:complete len:680 (-) Transcript_52211:74-2113(-)
MSPQAVSQHKDAPDGWSCFRGLGANQSNGGRSPGPQAESPEAALGFFEEVCGCSRDQYVRRHIDFAFQELVRRLSLSDTELYRLGRRHFQDQAHHLRAIQQDDGEILRVTSMKASAKERRPRAEKDDRNGLWDEEVDVNPFWWRSEIDSLCFDLPMCSEEQLVDGAPASCQWWDVEKIAESDSFVAISKPAGMFVVTDQRGLWEVSPTNFIHVAHRRFPMPSSNEPRQRGICHRLDSHTSGVQIFAKSWDGFRHFTVQNSAHRMQKEYVALVSGRLGGPGEPDVGLIDVPMKKWQDFSRREFGSVICASEGLPAVTKYKVLRHWWVPAQGKTRFWGQGRWFTLVQLRILTGRTHQIRVHMAFLGHPLVGDVKYSPSYVEQDSALVPRVFLHCLRMEFEDMDGSTFVAASDLSADLQVALGRLESLSGSVSSGEGAPDTRPGLAGFPGLARLLRRTAAPAPDAAPPAREEDDAARRPMVIRHRCRNCKELEKARCSEVRRGKRAALFWRVSLWEEGADEEPDAPGGARRDWGPELLWVPTELRQPEPPPAAACEEGRADPELLELGQEWVARGREWAWAHDGARQNGWFRLQEAGALESKWGSGAWRRLGAAPPLLLLVTFNGIEHALRLTDAGFDVVSRRRLSSEGSLAGDVQSAALGSGAPACCPTKGWPCPCPIGGR